MVLKKSFVLINPNWWNIRPSDYIQYRMLYLILFLSLASTRAQFWYLKSVCSYVQIGRLLIRRVVSSMLGIPYRCIKLARTDKGKPYILSSTDSTTPRLNCNFNISHHGDYVVIAAEAEKLVGVDIMKVEWPRKYFISLLKFRHVTFL